MDKKYYFPISMGAVALFIFFQRNLTTQSYSIMDTLLPTGTGLEKTVLFWFGMFAVTMLLVYLFYWKK